MVLYMYMHTDKLTADRPETTVDSRQKTEDSRQQYAYLIPSHIHKVFNVQDFTCIMHISCMRDESMVCSVWCTCIHVKCSIQ